MNELTSPPARLSRISQIPEIARLPMAAWLGELGPGRSVVQAPPGTGKTTAVPPALAQLVTGRVVVTQPRRIAARAAARRLAKITDTKLGEYAGFTVRGESRVSPHTRVEFVTTGVLLRRLLRDPELPGVGAVVLDEVHERHLDDDLTLAMVAELTELRDDLSCVAMSATLDAAKWAELLGGARIITVPDVLHPLSIEWAPPPGPPTDGRRVTDAFLRHITTVTQEAFSRAEGSALVFVPGRREVDAVVARLSADGVRAWPLHGGLSAREQDLALSDDGSRRVVVATAVAESSLTVSGVRLVVDSGLAREPRFDATRGVSGLVTIRESRSSAIQRAGRAGRLGPGIAVRCLAAEDWAGMAPSATAEVAVADLTGALLALACWGSPRGEGMRLPSPLPEAAVVRAEDELRTLGLVDEHGRITGRGREVARLPLEPRLGAALLAGANRYGVQAAAQAVALLSDEPAGDLGKELVRCRQGSKTWRSETTRLARLLGDDDGSQATAETVAFVVATARPGWVSRARESDYLSVSGTGFAWPAPSGGRWLAVWDTQRVGDRTVIRACCELPEELALETGEVRQHDVATLGDRVRVRRVRSLGAIELSATPITADPTLGAAVLREEIAQRGLKWLAWSENATTLRNRLALLHRVFGEPWPKVDDAALVEQLDHWLGPELNELARGKPVAQLDLTSALRRLVAWSEVNRFDELAPEKVQVASGSRIRLHYPADGLDVVCAVKLQECFGMAHTPTICAGRVSVLLHLLSPAGRPLALTRDLGSFWLNAYPAVRAENRGRYAKHPWPEDPLGALAMRGTKKQGR